MVKSEQIYSPQSYVGAVTGNYYFFKHNMTPLEEIRFLLDPELELWDYPLTEIDHIVENNLDVVLVDVSHYNEKDEFITEFRWFEVPEWFKEEAI